MVLQNKNIFSVPNNMMDLEYRWKCREKKGAICGWIISNRRRASGMAHGFASG
jgi:hypothetical protein